MLSISIRCTPPEEGGGIEMMSQHRGVASEVAARHASARLAHRRHDLVGDRAGIEGARAVARDRLERRRQVALHQPVARRGRGAVGLEEDPGRGRPARQPRLREQQRVDQVVLDRDAVARERERRRDQVGERELARAGAIERDRQARDRAGHADPEPALARFFRIGRAVGAEKDVGRRVARRGLAIVDRQVLVVLRQMHQHEAAAAEITGLRQRHGERKADRDRGVDRVAALFQDLDPDAARALFLRHHHAVAGRDGFDAQRRGDGTGRGGGLLRAHRGERGQAPHHRGERAAGEAEGWRRHGGPEVAPKHRAFSAPVDSASRSKIRPKGGGFGR
jgi:hypothetical protein